MGAIVRKAKELLGKSTRMKYLYAGYCSRPVVKNLVLFESFHGKDISDSPLYMAKALAEMPGAVEYDVYFATEDYGRHKAFIDSIGLDVKLVDIYSKKYAELLATAEYFVNNSSFPAYFIRREGQKYMQTWHGTPLKTLGKRMRMGMESMYNVQHNFLQATHLMFPNEFTRNVIMRDYNLDDLYTGKVAMCGYPRNSIFKDTAKADEVKAQLGNGDFTTMAYMPTWRGQSNHDVNRSEYNQEVNRILGALDETLSDRQKLYVNFHPIVQNDISLNSFRHIEPFPKNIDKYEFLNSVDALITDYSSVFFDYSITGKPVIMFMYDYEEYMADRGMYFDIRELPFRKIYELDELCECIKSESFRDDDYTSEGEYADRFIKYDSIDAGVQLDRLFFNDDPGEIPVIDFAGNLEKRWNVIDATDVNSTSGIDRIAEGIRSENEIVLFSRKHFNPVMSSHVYDNYLDEFNYVFMARSIPRTYGEEFRKRRDGKLRKEIHGRDVKRCFGNLNVNPEYIRKRELTGNVTALKTKGTRVEVKAHIPGKDLEIKGVSLIFRSELDDVRYPFAFAAAREGNGWDVSASIDMKPLNLDGIYWDIRVLAVKEGSTAEISLDLNRKFRNRLAVGCYQCDLGDYLIFPHVTIEKQLAFTHREKTAYDGRGTRIKELTALVLFKLFRRHWKKKKVWLVFEKFCSMAQDNGYYFFRYCMENLPEKDRKDIYYVMKKDADDWDKVACYGKNVLPFMSMKHILYCMVANIYVGSDSKKHLYLWRPKPNMVSRRMRRKKIMFLQHGVTALKKVDGLFGREGSSPMNHFTTTSEYEQKIVVDNFGYSEEDAPVLGFTRWDVLEDTSSPDEKIVLVMPTWRSWLEEKTAEEFTRSDYYSNYMKLLTDKDLEDFLKRQNVKLIFYIHPKFRDYLGEFTVDNENIELIPFGSTPLNEIMKKCSMLITDYSSVCWDVYYMGKPVIFYQFDYDMYMDIHGSYMDMPNELFGPRYMTVDELIRGMKDVVESGFKEDDEAARMRDYYFGYIDNNNCERTYKYLKGKGY